MLAGSWALCQLAAAGDAGLPVHEVITDALHTPPMLCTNTHAACSCVAQPP